MTPQELKNSILQLAIQGRLVEQRPEETVEELYREIQAEKRRLIKAGKIKKEKPLPEIAEEEKPFDIPENWMWVKITDCGYFVSGYTPKPEQLALSGTIPYFKVADMNTPGNELFLSISSSYIADDCGLKYFLKDTIVYPKNGGAVFTNKKRILAQDSVIDLNTGGYYPFSPLNLMYIFYYFLLIDFRMYWKGTALPTVDTERLKRNYVPIPPLAEQERIVAQIDKIIPLLNKYEQTWNRLEAFNKRFPDDMKKSILQLAIQGKLVEQRPEEGTGEELYLEIKKNKPEPNGARRGKKGNLSTKVTESEMPFDIPAQWKWVRMGELLSIISGVSYKKNDVQQQGIRVLRGGNIQDGRVFIWSDDVFLPREYDDPEKHVKKGDILVVASTGSKTVIGKSGYVDREMTDTVIGAFLRICRPHSLELSNYLRYIFESNYYRRHISELSRGTNINNVKESYITDFPIPLPPLAEQKRIVEKLNMLLPLCERLRQTGT